MKINLDELIEKLESKGFISIRVTFQETSKIQMLIHGDLDYFLKSIKALGENVLFISPYNFDESYLIYELESEMLGVYGENSDTTSENEVYLPNVKSELADFKQYIDEIAFLKFSSFYRERMLTYLHNADWYNDFQLLEGEAIEIVDANEENLKSEQESNQTALVEENLRQEAILIETLKTLLNDKKFARLGTQRAMQSYALEVLPELENLSPLTLKNEIQLLSDRLKARKLLDD